MSSRTGRVVLYGHDTYGLGHLRRNLRIAGSLRESLSGLEVFVLSGSPVLSQAIVPEGVTVIALPPVVKTGAERYESRSPGLSFEKVIKERSAIIVDTLRRVRPDLFIVDHAPVGVGGELREALDTIQGSSAIPILGMRDIIDTPDRVIPLWRDQNMYAALERYREIWVYGDRKIFDPGVAYKIPRSVAARMRFMGYLGQKEGNLGPSVPHPYVMVSAGGGEDGEPLFDVFFRAWPELRQLGLHAVVVPGPLYPEELQESMRRRVETAGAQVVLREGWGISSFLAGARAMISMAGYNTVTESMIYNLPTMLRPRTEPRREQWLRARSLAPYAPFEVLEPGSDEPSNLVRLTKRILEGPIRPVTVDLGGLKRVGQRVQELLALGHNAFNKQDPSGEAWTWGT